MKVKFFAFIRDHTGCKEGDYGYEPDIKALLQALAARYGEGLRRELFSADGQELGENIIILVNGRNVVHLQGIDTPLQPEDIVAVFPVVAGG